MIESAWNEAGKSGGSTNTGKISEISDAGITFLKKAEGFRAYIYDDGFGNLTGGWGHKLVGDEKKKYKDKDVVSIDDAKKWFAADLPDAEKIVNSKIVNGNISQSQYDALVDLAFNTGTLGPNLTKNVNSGDFNNAYFDFHTYNKQESAGLDTRRANEQRLFGFGNYTYTDGLHTLYWPMTNPKSKFYTPNFMSDLEKGIKSY